MLVEELLGATKVATHLASHVAASSIAVLCLGVRVGACVEAGVSAAVIAAEHPPARHLHRGMAVVDQDACALGSRPQGLPCRRLCGSCC